MDKFEKILREKLQNHDAGMGNGAWEQFAQRLNKAEGFENALREKLKDHDAGTPNGAWEQFAQRLQPKSLTWKHYLVGGIAATLLGVGAFYWLSDKEATNDVDKVATVKTLPSHSVQKNNGTTIEHGVENVKTNSVEPISDNSVSNKSNEVLLAPNQTDKLETKNNTTVNTNQLNSNNTTVKTDGVKQDVKKDNKKDDVVKVVNQTKDLQPVTAMLPKPEFVTSAFEVCQNSALEFTALNYKQGTQAVWLVNGEEVASSNEFKTSFVKPGQYTVQLVYATQINGARTTSESDKRTVVVLPQPNADFTLQKVNYESIPEYTFTAEDKNAKSYLWSTGDGKSSDESQLSHVFRKKGTYKTSLTITSENGCKATTVNKVDVENDYNLLAPNSFTPNGDGRNDVFIPEALKVMSDAQFRMTIYDKTGRKIFETQRIDNAWDGKNSSTGAMCQRDAYVWRVELTMPNGTKEEFIGSVTLLD